MGRAPHFLKSSISWRKSSSLTQCKSPCCYRPPLCLLPAGGAPSNRAWMVVEDSELLTCSAIWFSGLSSAAIYQMAWACPSAPRLRHQSGLSEKNPWRIRRYTCFSRCLPPSLLRGTQWGERSPTCGEAHGLWFRIAGFTPVGCVIFSNLVIPLESHVSCLYNEAKHKPIL